jgi:hypothetical protein
MWGPPTEIHLFTVGYPVEIWRYHYVEGVGAEIFINFSDPSGSGEFRRVLAPSER